MVTKAKPDLDAATLGFQRAVGCTRLRPVDLLRRRARVCEMTDALGAGQSRLSFHLRILKEAGLVLDRREGRWVYYRLNQEQVELLAAVLTDCCAPSRAWLKGCC